MAFEIFSLLEFATQSKNWTVSRDQKMLWIRWSHGTVVSDKFNLHENFECQSHESISFPLQVIFTE